MIYIFKNDTINKHPVYWRILDTNGSVIYSGLDKIGRDQMYDYLVSTKEYERHDLRLNAPRKESLKDC